MRLQKITFLPTLALSCAAFALAACGDDGSTGGSGAGSSGTSSVTTTDTDPQPNTTEDSVDTTAAPGDSTTDDPTTGLDSTGGDSSSGSDDGTTTGPMGDCADAGMSFSTLTSVDNDLITRLTAEGIVMCDRDITITATGGTVCVVDDGAGDYFYVVESITFEDLPPVECGDAVVGISDLSLENTGDGMEVVVPQGGGTLDGNQSIVVHGTVSGTIVLFGFRIDIPPTELEDFTGVLPEAEVAFGVDDTSATYADDMTVIATAMPEVMGQTISVTLTGLNGALTFAE